MKKHVIFFLVIICLLSFASCTKHQQTDNDTPIQSIKLSEYITEEDSKQYLVLPISKSKVRVYDKYKDRLENIDVELLKAAEETLNNKMSAYTDAPEFYLIVDDSGYLCLCSEWIVDIDPPNIVTDENGKIISSGCNIDHKHIYFNEPITKQSLPYFY